MEQSKTEHEVIPIDRDGDVILVVVNDANSIEAKLRVATTLLCRTSGVFAALFGPHFVEGQRLDRHDPPEVRLQDDSRSIILICQVLHHQCRKLPVALDANETLTLARTVDKYGLNESMTLALDRWLSPTSNLAELPFRLEAALLVRHHQAFHHIATAMLLNWRTSFVQIVDDDESSAEMVAVLYALESHRSQLRMNIHGLIFEEALRLGSACKCAWAASCARGVLQEAAHLHLITDNLTEVSISVAFTKLEMLGRTRLPSLESANQMCTSGRWHEGLDFVDDDFRDRITRLQRHVHLRLPYHEKWW